MKEVCLRLGRGTEDSFVISNSGSFLGIYIRILLIWYNKTMMDYIYTKKILQARGVHEDIVKYLKNLEDINVDIKRFSYHVLLGLLRV